MRIRLTHCLAGILVALIPTASSAQTNSTWNGTTGNWTDATRWSTNPIFPNNGQPNVGDTYNAIINGGTVTLDQNIVIQNINLQGNGVVTGANNLTLNGPNSLWAAANMLGTGTTTLNGNLNIDGVTINRNINNNAISTWDAFFTNSMAGTGTWNNQNGSTFRLINANGGSWNGTGVFNNQAGATFQKATNASSHNIGWTFNNSGTIDAAIGTLNFSTFQMNGGVLQGAGAVNLNGNTTWTAGNMSGAGTVTNNGTFTIDSSSNSSLARTFINQGILTQNAGNGITNISGAFTTSGAVNINSGTLKFSGGGSTSGSGNFSVASGATLLFSNSNLFTISAGNSISGAGNVNFSFTNVTINGTLAPTGLVTLDGGTLIQNTNATITSLQTGSFGNFNGSGNVAISGQSNLTQTTFGPSGTLTFNGPVALGNSVNFNRTVFSNATTTVVADAFISGSGNWTNQNGATLNFTGGVNWSEPITNQAGATVIKSGGATLADLSAAFGNAGTVQVNVGTMQLRGNVTTSGSGSYSVAAGATLLISGPSFTLPAGTSINGAGNVTFGGGSGYTIDGAFNATGDVAVTLGIVTFNVPATFSTLQATGNAQLLGSGNQVVTGASNIGPATLGGTGTTTFNGPVTLNTSGNALVLNRTINASGTTTWNGIGVSGTGTWNNQSGAVFDVTADNSWDVTFNNQLGSTLRKSAGSGTSTFFKPFTNAGTVNALSGTLAFNGGFTQTGGVTRLNGGAITSTSEMLFNAGSVVGSGLVGSAARFGNATIAPGASAGTITIGGNLVLNAGTSLNFELGSQSDLINVNGSLTLDGTLNIAALPGFGAGTFTILDYTGALTNNVLDLGSVPDGFDYQLIVDSANTRIDLLVTTAVPEPASIIMGTTFVLGSGAYTWRRYKKIKRRKRSKHKEKDEQRDSGQATRTQGA